jgi:hypothetical protein
MASVNSNLSPRGGKGHDRIVDHKVFSGQLFMIHALMVAMLFPLALRFHIANTTYEYYHEIFILACSRSGYP